MEFKTRTKINLRAFRWLIPMFIAAVAANFYPETQWLAAVILLISFILFSRSFVMKQVPESRLGRSIVWVWILFSLIVAGLVAVMFSGPVPEYLEEIGIPEDKAVPWVEEGAKFACAGGVILGLATRKRRGMLWALLFGGFIVGLTFGLVETLTSEKYLANFYLRLWTSIPSHTLWASLATAGLWFPLEKYQKYKLISLVLAFNIYFAAVIWHHLWNTGAFFEIMKWFSLPAVAFLFILMVVKIRKNPMVGNNCSFSDFGQLWTTDG